MYQFRLQRVRFEGCTPTWLVAKLMMTEEKRARVPVDLEVTSGVSVPKRCSIDKSKGI